MSTEPLSFIGLGYVGLCTAVCFAQRGFKTIGVDIDAEKIRMINEGATPIFEPSLENLLEQVLARGTLHLTTDSKEAIMESDISFITVGTPSQPDGKIDLQYIRSAARDIGEALKEKSTYHLVVVKSTVTPGTTRNTVNPLLEKYSKKRCGFDFGLCANPEFLREGNAVQDTLNPDRIIIGEHDQRSGEVLEALYRKFHQGHAVQILRTNLSTAELIKYANNAFLATKISYINTIANIFEKIPGADITTIAKSIGLDHRISPHFLRAGLGYGGSCFPKDLQALIAYSNEIGYKPHLLESVEQVNELQPLKAVEMVKKLIGSLQNKRIAILGLAFKPNTDDMRNAVSIKIIKRLLQEGAEVSAYDPAAVRNAKKIFREKITYASSMCKCLQDTDCCVIVTEWDEFKTLNPEDLITLMRTPALVDGRRITPPDIFRDRVKYAAVGLGPKPSS